ncbi:TSUP family transporter [Streptomyces sp. NPDC090306]|uniref:TSUP family transporter n=1 Tax=Streptomyces sp. NPDC090306 TaxID=3365961 RepID=UPI003815B600
MDVATVVGLLGIGLLTGVTTVVFGFGGGFVTVPVVVWADSALGADAVRVATATSALVMVVNAGLATAVTPRRTLAALRGSGPLVPLLAAGAAAGALAAGAAPAGLAHWAFVGYTTLTIADVLLRPGFLRPRGEAAGAAVPRPLPVALGVPIGGVAAFLGVGGSVMTVPAMRRAGHPMRVATALANPLTLAVAVPAAAVCLTGAGVPGPASAQVSLVGLVDVRAAVFLLAGALPVIAVLRRHPLRVPDRVHAVAYVALLAVVTGVMIALGDS